MACTRPCSFSKQMKATSTMSPYTAMISICVAKLEALQKRAKRRKTRQTGTETTELLFIGSGLTISWTLYLTALWLFHSLLWWSFPRHSISKPARAPVLLSSLAARTPQKLSPTHTASAKAVMCPGTKLQPLLVVGRWWFTTYTKCMFPLVLRHATKIRYLADSWHLLQRSVTLLRACLVFLSVMIWGCRCFPAKSWS